MFEIMYSHQFDYADVVHFIVRNLLHLGTIVSIWRFRQENCETYKPLVGILAAACCGVHAGIIFTSFHDLKTIGFDSYHLLSTLVVFMLYMYTIALKGNVAPMARPLIIVLDHVKGILHAK